MRLLFLSALYLSIFTALGASQPVDTPTTALFPAVSAYNLEKTKVNLPADFEGKLNLLLISFETGQAKDIDTWLPTAQAFQHLNFHFHYYKLPVANPENAILRWWDNSSLRGLETDPEMWHWIVPLYVKKDDFRRSLQIANEKQIAVLLTDQAGHVLWKESGPFTQEKKAALTAAVNAATTQH